MLVPMNALLLPLLLVAASPAPPEPLEENLTIQLIAAEPQVVTPIGCDFDPRGRLFVIESHTHFPPENYAGPKTDRILIVDDADADGVLERVRTFDVGGQATMGIEAAADGWIYVARRAELSRMRDTDGDDVADVHEPLARVDSPGEYPHNGLGDVVLGADGWLYFGMGENLGQPYTLVAADGSTQAGEAEGGNFFRCRPDGSRLERVATGFWNPFGICFDNHGRLWTVGNDPDASPPCRLVHVVPGGDYGFQFRFGRGGTSPLQSWNGSLPGTLPMAAGTGEAPSGVLMVGDSLWVTSWGDNRIERYRLTPRGASWEAQMDVVVQGNAEFRPVDMALAADGSVYVTDWVDRSYPVHGRGRIWRITRKEPPSAEGLPAPTEAEMRARSLATDPQMKAKERITTLEAQDPFLWQAAVWGLITHDQVSELESAVGAVGAGGRTARLAIARWRALTRSGAADPTSVERQIAAALEDESPQVRQYAARWIAESGRGAYLPQLRQWLVAEETTPQLFRVTVAAVTHLTEGSARGARDAAREQVLAEIVGDAERAERIRATALQMLPSEAEVVDDATLAKLALEGGEAISRDAILMLVDRKTPEARRALAELAGSERLAPERRADALAGLAPPSEEQLSLVSQLAERGPAPVAAEARRMLQRPLAVSSDNRPAIGDLDGWIKHLGSGGDAAAGRRVFLRAQCAACHQFDARGSHVGPDLTTIGGQMDRRRILESILHPAKEVGPMFVPWTVVTTDGRVLTGMKMDRPGVGGSAQFLAADGTTFAVPLAEIETQRPASTSIMPSGLQDSLSDEELRDLLAFLAEK